MRALLNFLFFTGLSMSSFVLNAGTEIQNGGGGVKIDGKVATFYGAEMQIQQTPIRNFPALEKLNSVIATLPLPAKTKLELTENITPSYARKYYNVKKESVDEHVLNTIKEEYSNVTGVAVENLTIFALTDSKTKTTLLLPDFYNLTENEQVTILFHESMWINKRITNYKDMLRLDKSFLTYLSYGPNDCYTLNSFITELETVFKTKAWGINSAFNCEVKKYLSYSNLTVVPMSDFFTQETLDTMAKIAISDFYYLKTVEDFTKQLITQLQSESESKVFSVSKNALVNELKKGAILAFTQRNLTLISSSPQSPLSKNSVDPFSWALSNAKFTVTQTDMFLSFSLNLPSIGIIQLNFNPEKRY